MVRLCREQERAENKRHGLKQSAGEHLLLTTNSRDSQQQQPRAGPSLPQRPTTLPLPSSHTSNKTLFSVLIGEIDVSGFQSPHSTKVTLSRDGVLFLAFLSSSFPVWRPIPSSGHLENVLIECEWITSRRIAGVAVSETRYSIRVGDIEEGVSRGA